MRARLDVLGAHIVARVHRRDAPPRVFDSHARLHLPANVLVRAVVPERALIVGAHFVTSGNGRARMRVAAVAEREGQRHLFTEAVH